MRNRVFRWTLGAVVSAFVTGVLVLQTTPERFHHLLSRVDPYFMGVALAVYLVCNLVRTMRFNELAGGGGPGLAKMYYLNAQYNFYTAIFTGVGEFSYPVILNRRHGVPFGAGMENLLVARAYDALFLAAAFSTSVVMLFTGSAQRAGVYIAVLLAAVTLLVAYGSGAVASFAQGAVGGLARRTGWISAGRVERILVDMGRSLSEGRRASVHIRLFLYTAVMWFAACFVFFCIFKSLGVGLAPLQTVFVATAVNLMSVVPVATIGGLGVKEAGVAGALVMLGFGKEEAVPLGMLARLFSLSFLFVLLAAAFVIGRAGGYREGTGR